MLGFSNPLAAEFVTDHGNVRAAGPIFLGRELTPDLEAPAEETEVVGEDASGAHGLRIIAAMRAPQSEDPLAPTSHKRATAAKRCRLRAPSIAAGRSGDRIGRTGKAAGSNEWPSQLHSGRLHL
jgi:hypothetical protein